MTEENTCRAIIVWSPPTAYNTTNQLIPKTDNVVFIFDKNWRTGICRYYNISGEYLYTDNMYGYFYPMLFAS